MDETTTDPLTAAREKTRLAARWLNVLSFKPSPAGPSVGPSLQSYHDMLAPETTDARRRAACAALAPSVLCAVVLEREKAKVAHANERAPDPYGAHWRTTERGAALAMIAKLLASAIETFEAAGVEA